MMRVAIMLAVSLSLSGCQKASESSDAKRMPKPPPPSPSSAVVDATAIAVEIDGAPAPLIDTAKLSATPPDFHDEEHRAWRLSTLVGPKAKLDGALISVTGQKDVSIVMRTSASKPEMPVLSVNRRGEVIVGLASPDQPFPAYHGRGGMLSRPGDPLPRIQGVSKIVVITSGDAGSRATVN
jgi:hypothetical protein